MRILGWAHLLEMKGFDLDETRRDRAIRTIARNAQIQAQLIDDLLDVSRIISGKMRLRSRPSTLPRSCRRRSTSVRPAAEAKGVDSSASVDPATGDVLGDADACSRSCGICSRTRSSSRRRAARSSARSSTRRESDRDRASADTGTASRRVPPLRVRSLPAGGQLDDAAPRRPRARARHRAAPRRAARRQRARGERRGRAGFDIHGPPARGVPCESVRRGCQLASPPPDSG